MGSGTFGKLSFGLVALGHAIFGMVEIHSLIIGELSPVFRAAAVGSWSGADGHCRAAGQAVAEILQLVAQHHTNQEMAQTLHLSSKTVRNYSSNIFSKLQVVDRAEAIMRARDAGLGA